MTTADATVELLIRDGEPVWEAVDFEIACPRCGYNLRMLTRPRCPECGLDFDWPTILNRSAWRSDFLFEHNWRARPVWSWLLTAGRSFRPFKFWRRVSIQERIEMRPLAFMLLGSILLFMLVLHAAAWLMARIFAALEPARPIIRLTSYYKGPGVYGELSAALDQFSRLPFTAGWDYLYFPGTAVLTLFAALALLSSLRQTLGRCRVRPRQLVRVVAYMSTPAAVYLAFFILGVIILGEVLHPDERSAIGIALITASLAIPPFVLGLLLTSGLRCYLKLPRPFLLGLTAGGVAFLFTLTVIVFSSLVARGGL